MSKDYSKMSPLDTVKVVVDDIEVGVTLGELAKLSFILGRSNGRGEHNLWKTVSDLFENVTSNHRGDIDLPCVCYYNVQKQVEELYFSSYFKKSRLDDVKQQIESLLNRTQALEVEHLQNTELLKKLREEYDKISNGELND